MPNMNGAIVRYGRGVWAVQGPNALPGAPAGYEQLIRQELVPLVLAPAMWRARQEGSLEGCTCGPLTVHDGGPMGGGVQAGPVAVHKVAARSTLLIIGHGLAQLTEGVQDSRKACPLSDPDGEAWANALMVDGSTKALRELWEGTRPFPEQPDALTGQEQENAPEAYEGEPVTIRVAGRPFTVPARHFPDSVRDAARDYARLEAQTQELRRVAREARQREQNAMHEATQAVKDAALSGSEPPNIATIIEARRREAQVTQARADGFEAALRARGTELGDAIRQATPVWTPYLRDHAVHLLGKAARLAADLRSVLDELVEVDGAYSTVTAGRFTASVRADVPASVHGDVSRVLSVLADGLAPVGWAAARQEATTRPEPATPEPAESDAEPPVMAA